MRSPAPWELAASPTGTHGTAAAWATALPSHLAGAFCSELCEQARARAQRQEQISVPTDILSLHLWPLTPVAFNLLSLPQFLSTIKWLDFPSNVFNFQIERKWQQKMSIL